MFYNILCHLCQRDKLCRFGSLLVSQGWGIRRWNQHVCVPGWYIKAQRESVCVYVCIRGACTYVGRFSQAPALWDFDNPHWITFMSHVSLHLIVIQTLLSLLLHSFTLTRFSYFPFTPHLSLSVCLSSFLPASLLCSETKGVGGQSHSPFQGSKSLFFLRFSHSCSVLHVAALLSCSTLPLPLRLPPSPTVRVWLVTEHLSGFCLLMSLPQLCAHIHVISDTLLCFHICTTPCNLCRCSRVLILPYYPYYIAIF